MIWGYHYFLETPIEFSTSVEPGRFRNLMSTAAGQKFLNENLHRTSVLSRGTKTCSVSYQGYTGITPFRFGFYWKKPLVCVFYCRKFPLRKKNAMIVGSGRIFQWCHHVVWGSLGSTEKSSASQLHCWDAYQAMQTSTMGLALQSKEELPGMQSGEAKELFGVTNHCGWGCFW